MEGDKAVSSLLIALRVIPTLNQNPNFERIVIQPDMYIVLKLPKYDIKYKIKICK